MYHVPQKGPGGGDCTKTAPTQEEMEARRKDELREELITAAYKWNDLTDQERLVAACSNPDALMEELQRQLTASIEGPPAQNTYNLGGGDGPGKKCSKGKGNCDPFFEQEEPGKKSGAAVHHCEAAEPTKPCANYRFLSEEDGSTAATLCCSGNHLYQSYWGV